MQKLGVAYPNYATLPAYADRVAERIVCGHREQLEGHRTP